MTPALGQGACQALEDAVVLTALAAGSADLATALTAQVCDVVTWALPTAAFLRATSGTFGCQTPARPHLTSPARSTP